MVKIEIRTENIGGDEELADALRWILSKYIEEGEVFGEFEAPDGEMIQFAVNPAAPLVGGR